MLRLVISAVIVTSSVIAGVRIGAAAQRIKHAEEKKANKE